MKLPPHIDFIERGWLSANMVLLGGDLRGPLVVDTGYVSHAPQTLALVAQHLQQQGHRAPRALLNTHLHSDHCGGNGALQSRYHTPVWMPPAEFEAAEAWHESLLSFVDTGQRCDRFVPNERLRPGSWFEQGNCRWEVHGAPGHDPASIILFEPRLGLLISADALWEKGFGIVFPELAARPALGAAFDEVEQTLDFIQALNPAMVLPGHGPLFTDTAAALREARSRLDYFRSEPIRHARHGGKALLMYHLLEWRERPWDAVEAWLEATPVQQRLRALAGAPDSQTWAQQLVDGLSKAGQVLVEGPLVRLRAEGER
ncbi:MBL fold metallo-hydrolase [Mitsuaria sp. WAJ17]|uniref:MBL fold metallo-hydrolase n=1 Tax=Mitsuaria sp. WAJ17 TaxID=2761452 RepID=UPI0016016782|nr:MBL fold metallo-hydrolase [Mitsuaria sp. WAJ17]MBB2488036.1 MBL fold metallo-hydrolase [Mitsuaria sp. WAJ17]